MKKKVVLISVMLIGVFFFSNCKNNVNDPVPSAKKKHAWVVGSMDSTNYGMILFTADAGDTWERQGHGSNALEGVNVSDIWAIDEHNVWAVANKNTILVTDNGGLTWTSTPSPENLPDAELSSVCISNKTDIWIGGNNMHTGIIYHSNDNGNSWTMIDTSFFKNNGIQGIWAVTPYIIYAVGPHFKGTKSERGFIGFTLDGGLTWDSISLADDYNQWEWIGVVSSGNTIVVYGTRAHYSVSTDGGVTWKNDSVPGTGGVGGADINDLIMLDSKTWWGAFDLGNIFITKDGGSTWTKQDSPLSVKNCFLVGIDTWDNQTALIASYAFYHPPVSPMIKTTNGGNTWDSTYAYKGQFWKVSFIKD